MKQKSLLSILLLTLALSGFSTVWTVNNSGFSFSPANITIKPGDEVKFVLSSSHNAVEVSQATYNSGGNTPLSGGFSLGFGGGTVSTDKLPIGTHYYVCTPHASSGMKGTIVVSNCTSPVTPGAISGNTSVCAGSINTYSVTSVSGATSYTWTLPSGWTGSSSSNSITLSAGTNGGTLSVKANNSCGSSASATLGLSVSNGPSVPGVISGSASVCANSSNTYSVASVAGATSYSWTLPSGWTGSSTSNSITVTAGSTGGDIKVKASNSCGSSGDQTLTVNINSIPGTPVTISGNLSVCGGSSNSYSIVDVPGATSYTWTLPGGWTGSSSSNSISAVAGNTGGNITVSANNGCGTSSLATLAVTVNNKPAAPGAISGNSIVCAGSSNTYSVTTVSGATSYTWALPVGWTGTSTTNSITVVAGNAGGNITVSANNGCGSSSLATLAVTLNNKPAAPVAISGNSTVCGGSSNTYSVVAVAGAVSYTWTLPVGWTGNSTSNSITSIAGNSGGNITVSAVNSCGSSSNQTFTVGVNNAPSTPATISGNATVCAKTMNTYSVASVAGATSYTWSFPAGWTGTSATNSITLKAGNLSGNVSVTATNSCGTSSQQSFAVTVNSVNISAVQSDKTITASATGALYQWIDCKTKAPLVGQTNQSFTATTNGSYAVIVTTGSCSDTSACFNVTTVGISNNIRNTGIVVYPNPSSGKFYISTDNFQLEKTANVLVYNSLGDVVFHSALNHSVTEIDLSSKAGGIYFVKVVDNEVLLTEKIMVKKQ